MYVFVKRKGIVKSTVDNVMYTLGERSYKTIRLMATAQVPVRKHILGHFFFSLRWGTMLIFS